MGQASRTTKLLLDFSNRSQGGANPGKRTRLEATVAILNAARRFYLDFFLAHQDRLRERIEVISKQTGEVSERLISADKGYDNDSYIFGPFVPLIHLLLSKVTILLQRVSSGERLSFCTSSLVSSSALPKSLVQETSPGAFSSGWEDRIRAAVTAAPGRAGNVQSG